jgi:uncharacterized protein YaaN involved in tellurite resistance
MCYNHSIKSREDDINMNEKIRRDEKVMGTKDLKFYGADVVEATAETVSVADEEVTTMPTVQEKHELATLNLNAVMTFGEDSKGNMKAIANRVVANVSNSVDTDGIMNSLQHIFNMIDYDELSAIATTKQQNAIQAFFTKVLRKKDKVMSKYLSVSSQIKNMYVDIKEWEQQLTTNKDMFNAIELELINTKEQLFRDIEAGNEYLAEMEAKRKDPNIETTNADIEIENIMREKIQELQYSVAVCDQSLGSIDIRRKTNYDIAKKLISIRDTTMPHLEILVSQAIKLKEARQMIESFQFMDEKARELLEFGTSEVINLGRQSANMAGINPKDMEAIGKSIESLKNAVKEINDTHMQRIGEINRSLEEYKLARGEM